MHLGLDFRWKMYNIGGHSKDDKRQQCKNKCVTFQLLILTFRIKAFYFFELFCSFFVLLLLHCRIVIIKVLHV